jgi:predicted ATPase/DNA-binding SARP family transcriptional activator
VKAKTPSMSELLEIRLLGPFEVLAGGTPADVGGSKRQGLLAMLALRQGRGVDVDALVDGLWGEELPAAPRNALHHHIARLRAALGEESIVGTADGYALKGARVDAARFEALLAETRAALRDGDAPAAADAVASALALWRGSALQGLTGTAWFSAEARRLETLHVDALEEDFEVRLALGEHRELTPALRSALADNPFRERLWAQLMLALYRSGRQADALETFQEARSVLADELGLEPGPELRRLQEAILAHDPAIAAVPVVRRRRGNLPAPSTSFVGREDELREVAALLHEHRLVTLAGPPGVGKSRLAVETARSLEHEFPDGIWLVDFARAGGPPDAVRLLAHVVDVRRTDPLAGGSSRFRYASVLVVLDACEHVLEEAGRIAATLLAECPHVRILGTSREALHVGGEVRIPVAPLRSAAVELFLERARAARPGFEPDAEAVAQAAEVARRVDGLPLAIELAAARVNVLGLAELVSTLQRRAALLRDSPASDPSHTALQELVEWSYDLLHGDEKTLLQELAVHRGGASLPSLAAVAATRGLNEPTVAYRVSALIDKSIVSASFAGGVARYDMLDTVREYVLERLAESGGLASTRGAHAEYFAALAEEARLKLRGREWLRWQRRLELENDNLWAALEYARDAPDPTVAIRLGTLGWYFALAERVSEGRGFLELALAATRDDAPVELLTELLSSLCFLATEELDLGAALEAGERALTLAASATEPKQPGLPQLTLALALAESGDERADVTAFDACATLEAVGDDWGAAASGLIRATGAARAADVATVAAMAATVLRHADAIGYDAFRVPGLLLEAWVAKRRGDGPAAVALYRDAL